MVNLNRKSDPEAAWITGIGCLSVAVTLAFWGFILYLLYLLVTWVVTK